MHLGPTTKDSVQLCKAAPHGDIFPSHISVRVHLGVLRHVHLGGSR